MVSINIGILLKCLCFCIAVVLQIFFLATPTSCFTCCSCLLQDTPHVLNFSFMLIINDGLNDFDLLEKQWVDLLSDPFKMIVNYSSYDYFIDMSLYDQSCMPPCFSNIFYSILLTLYTVQHWRSTATCAAALELPNLNYVHGQNFIYKHWSLAFLFYL